MWVGLFSTGPEIINSLLNISTLVPQELLGQGFRWNATPVSEFWNVREGYYKFLLVSHYCSSPPPATQSFGLMGGAI